jgi:hypothetical protein
MTIAQLPAPGNYPVLLFLNAALFATACVAFERLVRFVFPDDRDRLDRALLLAAFMVQPAFVASVVQPSLDLPLLPGFLWGVVFLLQRRTFAVALVASAMTFTKETGLLLYAALVGSYLVWEVSAPGGMARVRSGLRSRLLTLSVPAVLFAAYIGYRALNGLRPLMGTNAGTGGSFLGQLLVPRLDLYLVNFFILTLILNFAWIPAATIGLDGFVGVVHRLHRLERRSLGSVDRRVAALVALLAIVTAFVLSRFITYGNIRYYLVTTALVPVVFVVSLHRLQVPPRWRWGIISGYALTLLVSNVRTLDPVSRAVYGTFPFGRHDMLHMTRVTGECCGTGQDQLAYSLEFTVIHDLVDDALSTLAPPDSAVLIVPDSTSWFQIGPLDASTHRRTLRRHDIVHIPVSEPLAVLALATRPALAYYIALPNGNNDRALADLRRIYDVGPARRFERRGYSLATYVLRSPPRAQ